MNRYPVEVTSVLSPLVVVQGLGLNGIPEGSSRSIVTSSGSSDNKEDTDSKVQDKSIRLSSLDDPSNPFYSVLKNKESSETIERNFPVVQAANGLEIIDLLLKHNIGDNYWLHDNNVEYSKQLSYNVKFVGNQFKLPKPSNKPTRRSSSNTSSSTNSPVVVDASTFDSKSSSPQSSSVDSPIQYSRSPLSTLNKDSKYYQTILPLEWIQKYREVLPFVFISVHELDGDLTDIDSITKADLALAEEINRLKDQITKHRIKFLSLIVCSRSTVLVPGLDERVNTLRKLTTLPSRTGMLFLPAGTQRELETFVLSIVHLIKPWSTEFYSNLEKKLQKKKSQLLNPNAKEKFWLARHALKTAVFAEFKGINDYSTKALEFSYEKLIDAIKTIHMEDERETWEQCRLLIDFTGLHITRSYLIVGDANMAYKKFDIHIQNVLSLLSKDTVRSYPVISWLSLQLTWLSELLSLVSYNIIPIERALHPFTTSNWFGGSTLEVSGLSMPQGGYLYLQACSLMRRRKIQALDSINNKEKGDEEEHKVIDYYMALSEEDELKFDYSGACIKLLSSALEFFSRARKTKFERSESYIYFQLGEEHFSLRNYGMAVNNYLTALLIFKSESWDSIVAIILFRLYQCSIKLQNYKDSQLYYLRLCCLSPVYIEPFKKFIDINDIKDDEDVTDSSQSSINDSQPSQQQNKLILRDDIFESSIVFKDLNYSMNDTVYFQIFLKRKANNLMGDLQLNELHIQFSNNCKQIKIRHNSELLPISSERLTTFIDEVRKGKEDLQFESNLNFPPDDAFKILNFEISPNKIGKIRVESIRLKLSTNNNNIYFENQLKLSPKTSDRFKWFKYTIGNTLRFDIVRGRQSEFEVIPKQPKLEVSITHSKIAYSGQIFPITLKFYNKDEDRFGLQLAGNATIDDTQLELKWDKEDRESILYDYPDVLESESVTCVPFFVHIPILKNMKGTERVKVDVRFKYSIGNSPDATIESMKSIEIPVKLLFKLGFQISPCTNSKIPSVFNLNDKGEDGKLANIPVHDRVWLGNASIMNLSEDLEVDIKDVSFSITNTSSHSIVKLIDEMRNDVDVTIQKDNDPGAVLKTGESKIIEFNLLSKCLENYLKRSINVEIDVVFKYTCKSITHSSTHDDLLIVNNHRDLLWKGSLPHMDPRSLVVLHDSDIKGDDKPGNKVIEVEYILENPTSRIFQFSCSLGQSESVKILNFKNSFGFSLLPFMKQYIKFQYELVDGLKKGDRVKLPEFKIYDLNYKVYLNNLVSCEEIKTGGDSGLYYIV